MFFKYFIRGLAAALASAAVFALFAFSFRIFDRDKTEDDPKESVTVESESVESESVESEEPGSESQESESESEAVTEYVPDLDDNGVDLNVWERIEDTTGSIHGYIFDGKVYRFIGNIYPDDGESFYGVEYNGEKILTIYDGTPSENILIDRTVLFDFSSYGITVYDLETDIGGINLPTDFAIYVLKDNAEMPDNVIRPIEP